VIVEVLEEVINNLDGLVIEIPSVNAGGLRERQPFGDGIQDRDVVDEKPTVGILGRKVGGDPCRKNKNRRGVLDVLNGGFLLLDGDLFLLDRRLFLIDHELFFAILGRGLVRLDPIVLEIDRLKLVKKLAV
jgi:hypothetical protein